MSERTWQRADLSASRDRRITGERVRSATLEAALRLGDSAAPLVALAAVSDAVLITDRHGIVVYANPAWLTLTGHHDGLDSRDAHSSLIGQPIAEALEPKAAVRKIVGALRHEPTFRGALGVRHKTGRVIPVELTIAPSTEVEPHPSHFVLVARRAELSTTSPSALLDSVGRLASEIAHDFNNQISVVLNYTFILLRQLSDTSPLKEHVPQMQTAAWRASQVAQELLAFGGPRLTDAELLDLNAVMDRMQDLFRHGLHASVEVELRQSRSLWKVRGRLPHLEWMLLELALHARRTLGGVERWLVETWNEELDANSAPGSGHRHVVLHVHASPSTRPDETLIRTALGGRSLPEDPSTMPGVELALTHAHGTLSTTRDSAGGISYRLRLPAAS